MKIAILGSRGIPNKYGGFEQFAEYVSVGMVNSGHEVTVYSPHFHEYKKIDLKAYTSFIKNVLKVNSVLQRIFFMIIFA
jgi:hypothetical protein